MSSTFPFRAWISPLLLSMLTWISADILRIEATSDFKSRSIVPSRSLDSSRMPPSSLSTENRRVLIASMSLRVESSDPWVAQPVMVVTRNSKEYKKLFFIITTPQCEDTVTLYHEVSHDTIRMKRVLAGFRLIGL